MACEYYAGLNAAYTIPTARDQGNVQGQDQLNADDTATSQAVHNDIGGESVNMDIEAAAPAFKAPRAP